MKVESIDGDIVATIPEALASLMNESVDITPEPIAAYDQLETLQLDYNHVHSAFGDRDALSLDAAERESKQSRLGKVLLFLFCS